MLVGSLQSEVGEDSNTNMKFKTPLPFEKDCIVKVTFPTDIDLNLAPITSYRGIGMFSATDNTNFVVDFGA
jgi:hypothetical protein